MFVLFVLFLAPTLPIIHRWEVRLTLPLLFFLGFEVYIFYRAYREKGYLRIVCLCLVVLYVIMQIVNVKIQESSSLFLLDSQFSKNSRLYFDLNRTRIDRFK